MTELGTTKHYDTHTHTHNQELEKKILQRIDASHEKFTNALNKASKCSANLSHTEQSIVDRTTMGVDVSWKRIHQSGSAYAAMSLFVLHQFGNLI